MIQTIFFIKSSLQVFTFKELMIYMIYNENLLRKIIKKGPSFD
jgi:hypothetical protein